MRREGSWGSAAHVSRALVVALVLSGCGAVGPAGQDGATGKQGPPGPQGLQGVPGTQGEQGVVGPRGLQGQRGPTGPRGMQGQRGPTGPRGLQGQIGRPGPPGVSGQQGAPGLTGETGAQGPQGDTGPQGVAGTKGDTGAQGDTGAKGETGTRGDTGARGETGAVGPQGPAGPQGEQGPAGIQGLAGGFGAYGSFYDTTTVPLPQNQSTPVPLNTTDFSDGISIVSGSQITFAVAGKFNIMFSSQLEKGDAGTDLVSIWLRKNNLNVPWTNTDVVITSSGASSRHLVAFNFFVEATDGDFFQLMMTSTTSSQMVIRSVGPQTNPSRPEIPGTILTVSQVG